MASKNSSSEMREEILSIAKDMPNDMMILFLLKNLGPQRFSDIIDMCEGIISRTTVAKYLKLHSKKKYIEKKIHKKLPHYFITSYGIEKLQLDQGQLGEEISYTSKLNELTTQISDMIDFYERLGMEESIISRIIKLILKIGDRFFQLDLNRDLYLTLFYMENNFVLTQKYKFEITEFSKHYRVKKLRIDFYLDRIMSNKYGFYMFTRGEHRFFFHENDLLGKMIFTLINDKILEIIIRNNRDTNFHFYDLNLDKIAEEISQELKERDMIWEEDEQKNKKDIIKPFEKLIEKLFIKEALDMGFTEEILYDLAISSEKLFKEPEGQLTLINIVNGSDRYEDLNLVPVPEAHKEEIENITKNITGFCSNCGKVVLTKKLYFECPRCGISLPDKDLESNIKQAHKIYKEYYRKNLINEDIS